MIHSIFKKIYRLVKPEVEATRLLYRACNVDFSASLAHRIRSRLASRRLALRFGIYAAPTAKIGRSICLPHPTGIVIGEGAVIGDDVTIYQHVTIGRRRKSDASYPAIGDGSTIYAGAVIIGPIVIGPGSVIGANTVVAKSVPAQTVVSAGSVLQD